MASPFSISPGERFGPFMLGQRLGQGYMGEVYKATDERTGTTVALKMLRMQHTQNADLVRRARMEALVLAEIRHPNVVRVMDSGVTDDGIVWMAMEMLSGQTLRGVLQKSGALPLRLALHYIGGIVDGVAEAHRRSVVHRDIKPENVFITERNEVRVLDLGTAKFFGYGLKTTDHLVIIGTVPYMSPEHMAGEPIDARTDIYAIGVMLYEMLAGQHPFEDAMTSSLEMCMAHMFRIPKPLRTLAPHAPDYLEAVVNRAMSKKRQSRFRSMVELRQTLNAVLRRYEAEQREAAQKTAEHGAFFEHGIPSESAREPGSALRQEPTPRMRTAQVFESPPPPRPPDLDMLWMHFPPDRNERTLPSAGAAPSQPKSRATPASEAMERQASALADFGSTSRMQPGARAMQSNDTVELPAESPPPKRERDSEDGAMRTWSTPWRVRKLRWKQSALLFLAGCVSTCAAGGGMAYMLSLRTSPQNPAVPASVASPPAAAPSPLLVAPAAPVPPVLENATNPSPTVTAPPETTAPPAFSANVASPAAPAKTPAARTAPAPAPKKSGPLRRRLF